MSTHKGKVLSQNPKPTHTFRSIDHALKLLEEKDGSIEERVRVTERLGDIKTWTGQFDAGLEYWNRALTLWSQVENRKSVSRLHVKMAHAFWSVAGDKRKLPSIIRWL